MSLIYGMRDGLSMMPLAEWIREIVKTVVKSCVLYECLVYLEVRETGGAAYESQNYSE